MCTSSSLTISGSGFGSNDVFESSSIYVCENGEIYKNVYDTLNCERNPISSDPVTDIYQAPIQQECNSDPCNYIKQKLSLVLVTKLKFILIYTLYM